MPTWMILLVTGCYLVTGITEIYHGKYAWACVWIAYAAANIGLLGAMRG